MPPQHMGPLPPGDCCHQGTNATTAQRTTATRGPLALGDCCHHGTKDHCQHSTGDICHQGTTATRRPIPPRHRGPLPPGDHCHRVPAAAVPQARRAHQAAHHGVHHNSISPGLCTVLTVSGCAHQMIEERKGNGDSNFPGHQGQVWVISTQIFKLPNQGVHPWAKQGQQNPSNLNGCSLM